MGNEETIPSHVNLEDMTARIRSHSFFTDFPKPFLPKLASCAMPMEFEKDQVIFEVGDLANRFYLIESGKILLEAEGPEGQTVTLQTLGPGHVLGWSWLFPPHYWRFRAQTVEPTRVLFLYGTRLRDLAEEDPAFGYALMKRVSQVVIERLQDARKRLVELGCVGGP